jgi:putative membrane protein
MRNQVQHHEKDVRQFEQESKRATDPDVRAWAEKMLPILREHLQQAQTVSQSVTGSKGSGNAKKSGI